MNLRNEYLEFKSEIEQELIKLQKLKKELQPIIRRNEQYIKRAQASILHDFYNCCERIFLKILSDINHYKEEDIMWHKKILYKMTIPIKDIRPSVISEELAGELEEYLSFRHLFRHLYGFELKTEKFKHLIKNFNRVSNKFIKEIKEFLRKI